MADEHFFPCLSCGGINRLPGDKADDTPKCGRCGEGLATQGEPIEVDDARAKAWIAKSPVPILVDFWAPWCGPCRAFAPVLAKFAAARAGEMLILKIDTDQHGALAQHVGVQGIPTLGLWRDGKMVGVRSGAMSLVQLESWVSGELG